jgi:hypothetical protein
MDGGGRGVGRLVPFFSHNSQPPPHRLTDQEHSMKKPSFLDPDDDPEPATRSLFGRRKRAIPVPAPSGLDLGIPAAGDITESGLRTQWNDTVDTGAAMQARLEMLNLKTRLMEAIPGWIAEEHGLLTELARIRRRRVRAEAEIEALLREADALGPEGPADESSADLRRNAHMIASKTEEIAQDEGDVVRAINRLAQRLNSKPAQIYEEVEIIVAYYDAERELRAQKAPEEKGVWTTPDSEPERGIPGFVKRFGPLPIPSEEKLTEWIARMRVACHSSETEAADTTTSQDR